MFSIAHPICPHCLLARQKWVLLWGKECGCILRVIYLLYQIEAMKRRHSRRQKRGFQAESHKGNHCGLPIFFLWLWFQTDSMAVIYLLVFMWVQVREEKLRDFGVECGPWKVSSMFFKLQNPVGNASVSLVCSAEPWHKLTVLDQHSVSSAQEKCNCDTGIEARSCFYGNAICTRVKKGRKDRLSMRRELCQIKSGDNR